MALISTILTSFEKPEELKWAVESIQKQTVSEWEVIIADNSKDIGKKTAIRIYCEQLQKEDPRFLYFYKELTEKEREEVPYASMINYAYPLTSGKYLSYMCEDDLLFPGHYQELLKAIEEGNKKVAYTGAFILDKADVEEYKKTGKIKRVIGHLPSVLIRRCMFFTVDHNCVLHERKIFKEVGGWETESYYRRFSDAEFWYKIGKAGYEAYPTGKITVAKVHNPHGLNSGNEQKTIKIATGEQK